MLAVSACLGLTLSPPLAHLAHSARPSLSGAAPLTMSGEVNGDTQDLMGEGIDTGGFELDEHGIPILGESKVAADYVDPLGKPRPKYDLCAASGNPEEVCCGAVAPESAAELEEWTAHMLGRGPPPKPNCPSIKVLPQVRALALLNDIEAMTRSPDGTTAGYEGALRAAGFTTVTRVDLADADSRSAALEALREAKGARERICVHCADGTALTSLVMADWLLTDYIGGDNTEEAAETLRSRRRLGGVERIVDAEALASYIESGSTTPRESTDADDDEPPITVSAGGILLL